MTHLDSTLELLEQLNHFKLSDEIPESVIELAEHGADPEAIMAQVHALIIEGQLHHQATWAAHMTAPISPQSLFGQILSSLHNGNLLSPELYPALAAIEQQVINWLCQLFKQQYGHFTAGGSYGNLEALWQAKQANPETRIVYASTAAHYSINKACQLLDLDLRLIPCNDNEQMNADVLQSACLAAAPMAIIATAGTPAAGAFDPLDDCILLAQQHQAWCHIDAAWGGNLRLLPEYDQLFGQYLAKANSLCFDPHKAWAQPKPASILLYQRPISPMMPIEADYLQQAPSASLTGSRGGEVFLPLWFTIASLGVDALRQQSRLPLIQAQRFAEQLADRTTWPIYTSPTGIVCFETQKDLTELVKLGVLSQAKRAHKKVYRVVFTSTLVRANALITQLQPYF
jgi:glutamate/tyrosine decarboxylase-like PLP-dependent enzyme